MRKMHLIIDTDPGIDDAVALGLAFFTKKFKIDLIVASAGNGGSVKQLTNNALNLVDYFGQNIPVAQGASEPLEIKPFVLNGVHSEDGLGGVAFKKHNLTPTAEPAYEAMYRVLKQNGYKSTTLLMIAPATDVALLLTNYPDSKEYIKEIVFMGGNIEGLNNSGSFYASFNISCDPHAANVVYSSDLPITVVPTDLGHYAYLNKEEIAVMEKMNEAGKMFAAMFKNYHDRHIRPEIGAATHDPCALAYCYNNKMFETFPVMVRVNLDKNHLGEVGFTLGVSHSNIKICLRIRKKKFKKYFFKTLKRMK